MTQSQRACWGLVCPRVNSDQYGSLLIPVIMSKLPEEICVRGPRETTSTIWKIEELLEIIKQEVKAWKLTKTTFQNPQWTNTDNQNLQQQVHWFQWKIYQRNHIKSDVFTATNCTILHCVRRSQLWMIEVYHINSCRSTFYDQKKKQKTTLNFCTNHTQRPDQAIHEISMPIPWRALWKQNLKNHF